MLRAMTNVGFRQSESVFRQIGEWLLERADVRIDGGRPWDIQVHAPRAYRRALLEGSIGMGEGYLDGEWSCDDGWARGDPRGARGLVIFVTREAKPSKVALAPGRRL
jgi:hypothetical protein